MRITHLQEFISSEVVKYSKEEVLPLLEKGVDKKKEKQHIPYSACEKEEVSELKRQNVQLRETLKTFQQEMSQDLVWRKSREASLKMVFS